MRFFFIAAAVFATVAAPLAALAQTASSQVAPADEYFGQHAESVLEIRNRVSSIESKSDAQLQTSDRVGEIDYVEDSVMDWQQKYPADPWLRDIMSRLAQCYVRAHAVSSARATALTNVIATAYANSPATGDVLLTASVVPAPASQGVVTGEVVAASTGAPVPGAVVIVAANRESSDVTEAPFATTAADGSFAVAGVPAGSTDYIVVEPPHGSAYGAYHGVLDAAGDKTQAGIIRLAVR
jgi:hypothetical protein